MLSLQIFRERFKRPKGLDFLIIVAGTDGDVLPLLTIAANLESRGHRVTLLSPPQYRTALNGRVGFIPLSSNEDYKRSVQDLFLVSTRYAPLFLIRHAVGWNRVAYETILRLAPRKPIIVAADRVMLWADYQARVCLKTPVVRVEYDPPRLNNVEDQLVGIPFGRIQRSLAARLSLEWTKAMNDIGVRAGQGNLQRIRNIAYSSIPRIGLYPDWITGGNAKSLLPKTFGFVSPWENSYRSYEPVPNKGEDFIVFLAGTFGACGAWSPHFFSVSIEICRKLNLRGLLLGRDGLSIRNTAPDLVSWQAFAPLRQVLRGATLIVHHGGIGTTAAALDNGLPQLIIPRFAYQPSTAEWIRRLGVCVVMRPEDYTVSQGTKMIGALLAADNPYRRRASRFAGHCYSATVPDRICNFLENYAQ